MKSYLAYIRVSTTRQGEEGVSLQEQRRAILEYASKRGINVSEWFEEQISAAKRGRPVFTRLVGLLRSKKSGGLIIHKIDRGSRNLRDWADIGDLMDRGIEVHFAHESIDLHTRSGRLSADILAVVAADYIRNLREEVVKGINGRLRQGLFPFCAPIGYANNGAGKVKTIDPVRGPLVKLAFELYSSRQYSLQKLSDELFEKGFRTRYDHRVQVSQIATILRNPFYMGLIRLRNGKDTFAGSHEPLITASIFNNVQFILDGKRSVFKSPNPSLFRLLIRCEQCRLFVVGERHKGHVYYRCHRKACRAPFIREEKFEAAIVETLKRVNIMPDEEPILRDIIQKFKGNQGEVSQTLRRNAEVEHERIRHSIKTLLQKFLDNNISKETFDDEHTSLLMERKICEEKLGRLDEGRNLFPKTDEFLAALRSICQRFCTGSPGEMRKIMGEVFQEITLSGTVIHVTLTPFMEQIAGREKTQEGWERLFPVIVKELAEK